MWLIKVLAYKVLGLLLYGSFLHHQEFARYEFVLEETPYTRLCGTKNILTVNGQFPGPTIYVTKGETIIVDVYNKGRYNVTIHWHGVKQPQNPWSDGPQYITQCPIQPGAKFSQKVIFSSEEGSLWWHAHSDWTRATVHGAIVVYPTKGKSYPFPKPHAEVPIIIGEWWKSEIMEVFNAFHQSGGFPKFSNALTFNGQPGDLYPCSKPETFRLTVDYGKTYLLRIINAAIADMYFLSIANHNVTVVGTDGSYTKPLTTNYITIAPGQTFDVLLEANQSPHQQYYMAARAYFPRYVDEIDNTTTTAIIQYNGNNHNQSSLPPLMPYIPEYGDTSSSLRFMSSLRSLADKDHHLIDIQSNNITTKMFITLSINTFLCPNSCGGPDGTRLAASLNNISFLNPSVALLEAYYYNKEGVFGTHFPNFPPHVYNYISKNLPYDIETPRSGTEVKMLEYNSNVEIVLQGTNMTGGAVDHPMHLHGFSYYVVGSGLGIFDEEKDPLGYNLIDPPLQNTIVVPINGWTTIRFKANNPGVWYMHCHLDLHMTWGMDMVFIVKDGKAPEEQMLPPPKDMPPC